MNGIFKSPSQKFEGFRRSFNDNTIEFDIVNWVDDHLWNGFFGARVLYITSERPLSDVWDFVEIADALRGEV